MNKNNGLSQLLTAIIYIIVLFQASLAHARSGDELSIWASIDTYHVDRTNDEGNFEQNQVISVFYNRWHLGHFINSYRKHSWILGYQYWHYEKQWSAWRLGYGVSIAAATGYGRELATNIDGIITLGVSPYFGVKYALPEKWQIGADVLYIPTDNGGVVVSGINVGYRF